MAKGCWPDWEERFWVAIVGARKATKWGLTQAKKISKNLAACHCGIVSGLAYGIDSAAHAACVEADGVTWGVLGSGIDNIYPSRNKTLAEAMTKKGGYLSEFPLGSQPYPSHFIQRNRIISGLSHAVIIVEAAIHSGSLVTARYALEQGREVFVVVPPEEHVTYEGNKKLLEEGATPYESAEQILEEIKNWKTGTGHASRPSAPPQTRVPLAADLLSSAPLIQFLKRPTSLDQLVSKTKKLPQELLAELLQLETEGFIKKSPGPLWQSL